MPLYQISLSRSFLVTIEAPNEERANFLSEFFIGDCPDISKQFDREEFQFQIHEIEMATNEAVDVKLYEEDATEIEEESSFEDGALDDEESKSS
jgi:hypothetical protein